MSIDTLNLMEQDHTLIWRTANALSNSFEAKEISNRIKQLITSEEIERMVVDNRSLVGTWSPEIDAIWIDLMRFMPIHVKRTATLCHDVIGKIQLNYLSSQAGTIESVRAFTPAELKEMQNFLELDHLPL